MDLSHLRSLITVVEHGAITEAGRALGLSQPALSRRIKLLEEDFGTSLLARSQRGVALTEMGRLVVAEARELVSRYERLKETVDAHLRLDTGIVRVGGGATAVAYVMPPVISHFQETHPGVVFHLKEAGSREIESDVLAERLELGIVTTPVRHQDLDVFPVVRDRVVLVAGQDHPLASRKRIDLAALRGMAVVGFEAGSAIRQLVDTALRNADTEMNVSMELRSIPAILQLAISTRSLAFVSELCVGDDTRIRILPVRGLNVRRELAIIRKRGRPGSPAGDAFADAILEKTRKHRC